MFDELNLRFLGRSRVVVVAVEVVVRVRDHDIWASDDCDGETCDFGEDIASATAD